MCVPELLAYVQQMTYVKDGTGILMANGQWRGIPLIGRWEWEVAAKDLIEKLGRPLELAHVMVNTIPPGVESGWHVDPEPGERFFRWHLPLVTNERCWFEEEAGELIHMPVGWWCGPVNYWERHRVWNDGSADRTHLILDLIASR